MTGNAPTPAALTPPDSSGGSLRFALGLIIVATGAAAFAVGFRTALATLTRVATGQSDVVSAMRHLPVGVRMGAPALGGLIAGALGLLVRRASGGQGVSDVMEAVVLGRVRLSMRVTLFKSLGSFAAIASGGSLGREGPLIQFGGALGNLAGRRLGIRSNRLRQLIAAGTAAGFAAAYNTPLAAVLFVLEVVTGVVVLDVIVPTLIAVAASIALTRAAIGPGPIYGQRGFAMSSSWELLAFLGLGVVSALGAQAFMRLLQWTKHCFRTPWLKVPWRSALGGAIAGAIIAVLPEVAGNGYEPLNSLLDGRMTAGFVMLLLLGKILATAASVSSGSPGGVFTPTLLIGGALGFLYQQGLLGCGASIGSAGGYALVGMAAATAATTHAPLMAAVMAFELTGDYGIVLPLVLATAIATFLSRSLQRESIYGAELRERGIGWELTLEGRRMLDSESRDPK